MHTHSVWLISLDICIDKCLGPFSACQQMMLKKDSAGAATLAAAAAEAAAPVVVVFEVL